jgi:hypothetical protein
MKKLIFMFLAVFATFVACNTTPEPVEPVFKESIELMAESVTFQAEGAAPQQVEVVLENCTNGMFLFWMEIGSLWRKSKQTRLQSNSP